jgi:hypothetical protein
MRRATKHLVPNAFVVESPMPYIVLEQESKKIVVFQSFRVQTVFQLICAAKTCPATILCKSLKVLDKFSDYFFQKVNSFLRRLPNRLHQTPVEMPSINHYSRKRRK